MARKYLGRIVKESTSESVFSDTERTHMAESSSRYSDEMDPMAATDRALLFIDKLPKQKENYRSVKKTSSQTSLSPPDKSQESKQYMRYIQNNSKDIKSRIEEIKESNARFDHQISLLKYDNYDNLDYLDKIQMDGLSIEEIDKLLYSLMMRKRITESKLEYFEKKFEITKMEFQKQFEHFEGKISNVKKELQQQQIQIDHVNDHLETKKIDGDKDSTANLQKTTTILNNNNTSPVEEKKTPESNLEEKHRPNILSNDYIHTNQYHHRQSG